MKGVKGVNFYRDEKKQKQLKVLNSGKAIRNAKGDVIKEAIYQSKLPSGTRARVEPNRKWFENTRTISTQEIQKYELATATKSPFEFVLRSKHLPVELINQPKETLQKYKNFSEAFGPGMKRKRPTLAQQDIEELAESSNKKLKEYDSDNDNYDQSKEYGSEKNPIFQKGTSKRIYNELYKVIDSSDVIIHVLDARDPLGTRCDNVIKHLQTLRHKQLVFVLNKVDLVPTWVTERWKQYLEKEYPVVAFHANINNPFGKASLINLLRQFSKLHSDKKQISIGFVGYPNTGKSSIINTLKQKKVCNVAPIPGETRVWQYVALMKRIYLIDCPGVVYGSANDSETDIILKGVVRVENVDSAQDHIQPVLDRVRKEYLLRTYNLKDFTDAGDFLSQIAVKSGKLLKGGEPDENTIAKMVLNDWVRGKIPFYTLPPDYVKDEDLGEEEKERKKIRVNQRTNNIRVVAGFMDDDIRGPENLVLNEDSDVEEEGDGEVAADGDDEEFDAEWDEVFEGVDGELAKQSTAAENVDEGESEDKDSDVEDDEVVEEESEEEVAPKPKRMTTNKKKPTNYYTTANVKNKNRNRIKRK